jgi:hypothetical protein
MRAFASVALSVVTFTLAGCAHTEASADRQLALQEVALCHSLIFTAIRPAGYVLGVQSEGYMPDDPPTRLLDVLRGRPASAFLYSAFFSPQGLPRKQAAGYAFLVAGLPSFTDPRHATLRISATDSNGSVRIVLYAMVLQDTGWAVAAYYVEAIVQSPGNCFPEEPGRT